MFSFKTLPSPSIAGTSARLGRLIVSKSHVLDTPTFISQGSRGVVPHLSHDTLQNHTDIKGVYTALEDFVEKNPGKQPIYTTPTTLRQFISLPSTQFSILAPRRAPPISCPAANTDDSISILTSVGYRFLTWQDYSKAVKKLRPDVVVSMPDIPDQKPGKNRGPKMVMRTELWLRELLGHNREWAEEECIASEVGQKGRTPIFAPLLTLEIEEQRLYLEFLGERKEEISGLAIYDYRQLLEALYSDNPLLEEMGLADLPRLSLDNPRTPLGVLDQIEAGVDVLSANFVQEATDAGIALDFYFPTVDTGLQRAESGNREKKVLGLDMWGFEYAADLRLLSFGLGGGEEGQGGRTCDCYACRRHHRAYVQHLLQAKEMTAWVLLQIHNYHIFQKFFVAVRASIAAGTYDQDKEVFRNTYVEELPEKTGQGPRVRGYQFKTEGGAKKKNPPAFKSKGLGEGHDDGQSEAGGVSIGGDEKEKLEEAGEVDTEELVERGMGRISVIDDSLTG
ncbi:tRNA-guanine(15) transglycosylase-like protein [Terfezia claveryi]|nr:tRNA-guanine(15) transglycosylase-like protein [Terfezia claveryi]